MAKTPRLGRGLSSLMTAPVTIIPPETPTPPLAKAPQPAPAAPTPATPPAAKTAPAVLETPSKPAPAARNAGSVVAKPPSPALPKSAPAVPPRSAPAIKPAASAANKVAPAARPADSRPAAATPPAPAPTASIAPAASLPALDAGPVGDAIRYIPVDAIRPNPHQPRQQFNESSIDRLAESIRSEGLMQPIMVRGLAGGKSFELVAGERRWRAARKAGLTQIPAIVRDLNDRQLAEWALIENLQREDLNPIERAIAFQHLMDRFTLSHEEIAKRVGIERSTVSNTLRLLDLCNDVRTLVQEGLLSAGHARALISISDPQQQLLLARRIVREALSVRQVEALVRKAAAGGLDATETAIRSPRAAVHGDLERQIGRQLGVKVRIRPGRKKGAGTLAIRFDSLEQFDRLIDRLGVEVEQS